MGLIDELKEKNKKKQTTTTSGGLIDELKRRGELLKSSGSKKYEVNQDFINSFISDANSFLDSAEKDYSSIGWGNASSSYDNKYTSLADIYSRSTAIHDWLSSNKNNLDNETYKSLSEALGSYNSGLFSVLDSYKSAKDYFGQWETEDAYNTYAAEQEWLKSDDFKANSQYVSTVSYAPLGKPEFGDKTYEYINNQTIKDNRWLGAGEKDARYFIESEHDTYSADNKFDNGESFYEERGYDLLEPDEVSIYNYYYNTEGSERAQEYLDSIQNILSYRKAGKIVERIGDSNLLAILFAAEAGLDQFKSGIGNIDNFIMGTEADPTSATQYASSMIREKLDGGWGVAYDAISTTANMLPSVLVSMVPVLGKPLGLATMGTSAIGNAYAEMKNLGYDEWQSRGYAALVGASEMVLQSVLGGISKLGGKYSVSAAVSKFVSKVDNALAKVAIKLGGNMASEGLEEAIQTALEPAFKALMTGEDIEGAEWDEILYSMLLGALSAGVMEGAPTIYSTAKSNIGAKKIYGDGKDLVAEGLEIGGDAGALAEKYQKNRIDKSKKLTGSQINRLNEEIFNSDVTKLKDSIGQKLTEYGETGKKSKITDALVNYAMGKKSTSKDTRTLNKSKKGYLVATELDPTNIESGGLANKWSEKIGTRRINPLAYNKENYKANATPGDIKLKEFASAGEPPETKFEVSESGETIVGDKKVNIKEIASIKDGEITLRLDNGETVNANEVEFSSNDEGLLYESAIDMGLNAATANAFVKGFEPGDGLSIQEYVLGFWEAYRYGSYGIPIKEMSRDGLSFVLPEAKRSLAYNLGKTDAKYKITEKQNKVTEAKEAPKSEKASKTKGKLYNTIKPTNERQRTSLKALEVLADALGINIHIFESGVGSNGKRVGANGWYDPKSGSIHIDLYAGQNGESTMLFTASHELTHFIRDWSPAKFKVFADFLFEQYGEKGISVSDLVRKQIDKAKRNGRTISYDTAYEEVVADACETMLTDSNAIEVLAKLKAKDKSLWQKIKDFITGLVTRIRNAYKGMTPDSEEAAYVRTMLDAAERLQALWTEALVDAGETYSEVRNALGEGSIVKVNENGEFTVGQSKDGTVLYNDRTYDEGGRETLKATLEAEGFTKEDIDAALTIIDAKHDLVKRLGEEFSAQDVANKATLVTDIKNGHSVLSALVKNGDYPVNIDLLTVCKKRQAYQRVINRLCETGLIEQATLDSLAIAEINKILGKYGFETACLGCFVESKRLRIQEYAELICNEWNELVDKKVGKGKAKDFGFAKETFVKDLSEAEIQKLTDEYEKAVTKEGKVNVGTGSYAKKFEKLMDSVPALRKRLTISDIATPKGMANLKSVSPELFALVASRYGSGSPKPVQDFNPYNSELAKYGLKPKGYSSLREYLYAIGGARMQSFSDFIIENWFDYCQIVADLAAKKLPMHTYTKEITLAKLFGMTGIKVNMSLIPDIDRSLGKEYAGLTKNAKGEYELIFADKDRFKASGGKTYMQSINFADAIELQNDPRYSANIGTIAVGISDNHIRMMLDDSRIRMIIPYHSSAINPVFANLSGIDYYKDYTEDQTTKVSALFDSKGVKRELSLTKEQKAKLTSGFEFNEVLQRLGDARETAQAYLEWCADASQHTININGETYTAVLTPKFNDFSEHRNYYKLLEDFNTYDCVTEEAAPQGDVRQIYPDNFEEVLRDELASRENYHKKQDAKFDTAMGEIESYLKEHTKAETKSYAKEHEIKLSDRDSDYMDAVNRGDMETAQRMVDEAAREAGYTVKGYHGTGEDFNIFSEEKVGKRNVWGRGFYFGSSKGIADDYASWRASKGGKYRIVSANLKFNNPYIPSKSSIGSAEDILDRWFPDMWQTSRELGIGYIEGKLDGSTLDLLQFIAEHNNIEVKDVLAEYGYDGVKDGGEIVAFYSEQIKSADPVTYDDDGNIIPLSERFNPKNDDIRYSFRDSESGMANDALSQYDEELAHFIRQRGDYIVDSFEKLKEVVNLAFDDPNRKATAYFGIINADTLEKIKNSIPNLPQASKDILFKEGKDYSIATTFDAIRHIVDEKGLSREDVIEYLDRLADTVLEFDSVFFDYYTDSYKNKIPGLLFKKKFDDGTLVSFNLVSQKKRSILLQTLYMDGADYQKKKAAETLLMQNTSAHTPEARVGQPSVDSIAQDAEFVKREFSDAEEKRSDRDTDSVSNRSLLAGALESVAENDIEKSKLKQYKEKIALIEAEQKKLSEIRAKSNELRFTKGRTPSETKTMRDLDFEANQIANRISTYDKQLLNLESTKALKNVLDREKEMARKRAEQKGKEALKAYKERAAETVRELMTRNTESRKKAIEGRHKTELRNKLKSTIADLRKILNHGTKERNVKIELQDSVSKALALADILLSDEYNNEAIVRLGVESVTDKEAEMLKEYNEILDVLSPYRTQLETMRQELVELRRNKAPESEIEALKARMDEIRNLPEYTKASQRKSALNSALADVFVRERNRYDKEKAVSLIDALVSAYESLQSSEVDYIKGAYDAGLRERLVAIRDTFGNVSIKDMSLENLEEIYKAFSMVKHVITDANTLFRKGRKEDLGKRIKAVQDGLRAMNKEGKDRPAYLEKIMGLLRSFSWNNLRPVDAFERLGVDAFTELFWDAVAAQDTYAKDVVEAGELISKAREKYQYKTWDLKTAKAFETSNGLEFKLTLEDIMSIYAYSFREQAYEHMSIGGFTFDTGKTYKEKKHGKAYTHAILTDTYLVNDAIINDIISTLTEEQKAYVREVQKYLTQIGEKGNEVARILYGIDLFTEESYFPLQSSADYRSSVEQALNATQTMASLKNTGMTKPTVPHARNPIVLRSFDDVVLEHIDKMSKYHAYVIPIENMQKVFNNSNQEDIERSPISTQALISSIFGREATAYFNQYITDLNGGSTVSGANNPLASFFGKAKGVSVAANLSVVAQQYFAVVRAMAEVNPKYFVPFLNGSASKSDDSSYEELKKYAPVAIIKEMGGFDIGSKSGAKDYIGSEGTPLDGKKVWNKFQDFTMLGASLMDKFGWVTIWKAIKKEVASTHKDLKVGSEEFLKAAGERFREVVTKTQVYDSVNTRSGYMRSKHESVKYLTSFMGEPTVSIGMFFTATNNLIRAIRNKDKVATKKALGRMLRVYAVLPAAGALTAAAKSIVQALRDDDEDETLREKWIEHYVSNFKDDINPLNYLPVGRDIMSIINGWDVERPDMTLISDLITSAQRVFDEDATGEEILGAVEAVANILGIPLKNVIRDTKGFINAINGYGGESTDTGISEAIKEGWTGKGSSTTEKIYQAIISGDKERVELYKSQYETEKEYQAAVKKALRENDPRITEAARARYDGDIAEYKRIAKEIIAEGYFSQDIVVGAVNAAVSAIKNDETTEDVETEEKDEASSIYKASDLNAAFESGDNTMALEVIEDLVKTKVANGKTEKEAKSSVRSSMTSYWKPLYLEAYKSGNSAEMQRIRKILYASGLYGGGNEVVLTVQDWVKKS